MSGEMRVEWAIDYPDNAGPIPTNDEWVARNWLAYWNDHREDRDPAVLLRREVRTTEWEPQP